MPSQISSGVPTLRSIGPMANITIQPMARYIRVETSSKRPVKNSLKMMPAKAMLQLMPNSHQPPSSRRAIRVNGV